MDTLSSLPTWKKVLFGILTLSVFFASIELMLALAGVKPLFVTEDPFVGFAGNIPLYVEQVQPDGVVMLATAKNKLKFFNPQQFPKIKGKNTYRIFCMGGSTTYGHPFFDEGSFCGWLREFLRDADPSKNWEVINAGGISYASYRVVNLMNELSQYQPDLFIVYSGQNEFLEERTYRNIKEIPEWVMTARVALSKTRTFTVLSKILDRVAKKQSRPGNKQFTLNAEVNEILGHTVGPTSYTRDDELSKEIISHYKLNLKRMISVAKSSGSGIIFVTPASSVKDIPPFKSENRTGMADAEKALWTSLYDEGKKLQAAGKAVAALARFNEALKIDSRHADLNYRVGQVLFTLKRFEESRTFFLRAVDEDICPLRILSPMSNDLHDVIKENNVSSIDFVKLIDDDCRRRYGHNIPGQEYFVDHVHPTLDGYRMLGLALFDELARQGIVKTTSRWNDKAIAAVTERMKLKNSSASMKIGILRNLAMTTNWSGRLEKADSLLMQALHEEKDAKNRGLIYDTLADVSLSRGHIDKAIEYWYKSLPSWPDNNTIRTTLANLLLRTGRLEEALTQNYEILRIFDARKRNTNNGDVDLYDPITVEDVINARNNAAQILSLQGRTKEAIAQYAEVLKLKPDEAAAHRRIGELLAKEGRVADAIAHLLTALKIDPAVSAVHYDLGFIYEQQGKFDEAIAHYSEALRIDPDSYEMHNNLGVALAKQGKLAEATVHFFAVLKGDPNNVNAHYNLGRALALQGRKEESESHIREADRIQASVRSGGRESNH